MQKYIVESGSPALDLTSASVNIQAKLSYKVYIEERAHINRERVIILHYTYVSRLVVLLLA